MDEKKLELRLGPPGGDDEYPSPNPALSLGFTCIGAKRGFSATIHPKNKVFKQQQQQQQQPEIIKQQCPLPSAKNAAAGQGSSQTRETSAPVVGWPPLRSFRKNLASSSSSKPTPESTDGSSEKVAKLETSTKGLFLKINMDGIPIGRKIDLNAYESYEKLSLAVDELFSGFLLTQRQPFAAGTRRSLEKERAITGLLDGSGEFTLVYEDDEGDRMLVGDVPWEMFVSTAKRLRVLKSSELSTLRLGSIDKKRRNIGELRF